MDVIFRDMTPDYLHLISVTDFSDEISGSGANTARQNRFVVLSSPNEMVFAVEDGMRRFSVELHYYYSTILKGPPEGVGFTPKD